MSGKPVKKCLRCGVKRPSAGPWHVVDDRAGAQDRYLKVREKLCFLCVRDFDYAETYLLFHEISEAYPQP